ncbi:MAG: hypothetical protein GVY06_11220, partial [Alphaproteobacteria bacterium]|nr:hypothetical protein [Alphaproteobacteria bacterium]
MDKDLAYIVSGGRTGTKYFGEMLCDFIPEAYSVHEPDLLDVEDPRKLLGQIRTFGLWHMVFGRLMGKTGIRTLATRHLAGKVSDEIQFLERVRAQRASYYDSLESPLIIESYSQWYGLLPQIRELYPDARIVGIIRDPRDWVVSWLNHGRRHDGRDRVTLFGQKRLTPVMVGEADLVPDWEALTPFERLCWDWRIVNNTIVDFCDQDEASRIYRFEDLFLGEDDTAMRDLINFVAQHPSRTYEHTYDAQLRRQKVNTRASRAERWPQWTPEQVQHLEKMCQPLMSRFG